jgi:hypothetical protein
LHREKVHREKVHREKVHREKVHREKVHREKVHREKVSGTFSSWCQDVSGGEKGSGTLSPQGEGR